MRRAAVLAGVATVLAACSSIPHGAVALTCPARTPDPRGTTLPSAAVRALACLADQPPAKRRPGVPVPRDIAAVLARSVDAAPRASDAELRQCPRTGTGVHVVIRFATADGAVTDLVEAAPACGAGIAYVGRTGRRLTRALGEFVFDLTSPATDPSGIETVLSRPTAAPACTGRQLSASYGAGGVGTGNDFSRLVIRNASASRCELRGPVTVTGLDERGRSVTASVRAAMPAPIVLDRASTATVGLAAGYRDDPSAPNGLCRPHWVAPYSWRLEVAGRQLTVRNGRGDPEQRPGFNGLVTCRGAFTATARGPAG